ncbi:MAG: hypothetical protein ACQERN_06430 [Thermodesulfobacteriota bacterium]
MPLCKCHFSRRLLGICVLAALMWLVSPGWDGPRFVAHGAEKAESGQMPAGTDPADASLDAAKPADNTASDIPEFDTDWSMEGDFATAENDAELTWGVDVAFENLFNLESEDHFQDAYEKNEISTRIDLSYGTSRTYVKSITDFYVLPTFINDEIGDAYFYASESNIARNLRISGRESEIIFRELYLNYPLENGRLRIGNQIYSWGTADAINATAYLNPRDLRELLFINEDHQKFGVPSVSGMYFFNRFTTELVWVPVHVASAIPGTGHFWAIDRAENNYPLFFDDPQPLTVKSENMGYAARVSSSYRGMDFSFSGYHGPDTEPVFRPFATVLEPNQPLGIRVKPYYDTVDYLGFDFSTSLGDFVFQVEGAYSPNKSGFVLQDTDDPTTLEFPFAVQESDYYAYSAGFNYFIPMHRLLKGHAGDSLFTMEWYQARYRKAELNDPILSDFLTFRYQDDFFDKRIHVEISTIFETRDGGLIFWPQAAYDFQNGFKLGVEYAAINGDGQGDWETDSLFYYYRTNDFVMLTLEYAYPS